MLDYHIIWSIYVQARSIQKVRSTHLPAIEKKIGAPQKQWLIEWDEVGDGQTRLTAINNHSAASRAEAILHILSLAGKLAGGGWNVSGLQLLNTDGYFHVIAHRVWRKPEPVAPALTDVLIEAEQGVYAPDPS